MYFSSEEKGNICSFLYSLCPATMCAMGIDRIVAYHFACLSVDGLPDRPIRSIAKLTQHSIPGQVANCYLELGHGHLG